MRAYTLEERFGETSTTEYCMVASEPSCTRLDPMLHTLDLYVRPFSTLYFGSS